MFIKNGKTLRMEKKTTQERIKEAYLDHVLTQNAKPVSVYAFMKKLRLSEKVFYTHFTSFDDLEATLWDELFRETRSAVTGSAEFASFNAREKTLSLFYGFTESMKPSRSFIQYSIRQSPAFPGEPRVLRKVRRSFQEFCEQVIAQGLESGELSRRKHLDHRYKDALWLQFVFIIRFWTNDTSADFEKTDEAIEKGVQLTFDLMGHSPLDNLVEYGKFLFRNARFVYERAK